MIHATFLFLSAELQVNQNKYFVDEFWYNFCQIGSLNLTDFSEVSRIVLFHSDCVMFSRLLQQNLRVTSSLVSTNFKKQLATVFKVRNLLDAKLLRLLTYLHKLTTWSAPCAEIGIESMAKSKPIRYCNFGAFLSKRLSISTMFRSWIYFYLRISTYFTLSQDWTYFNPNG